MPLIMLEKPGVESARGGKLPSSPTGQLAGLGPHCAGEGAAARRRQLQRKSPRRRDSAGIRWVRLAAGWASHSCLAELRTSPPTPTRKRASLHAIGTRRGVPTARAHKRQPTQGEGPGPGPGPLSEAGQAVPRDTPGSAFSRRHRGTRPDGQQVDVADKW